jgi:protein TonB
MADTLALSRVAPRAAAPRRAGAAAVVLAAHVFVLVALLSIPAIRAEAPLAEPVRVVLVRPPASTPSPVPTQVAAVEAPAPIPVQFAPSPIEIPAFAPPKSAAPAEAPVVVTLLAPATDAVETPPTIESVSYVREPDVRYPPLSRRMKEQGLVVVRVLIGADGRAASVEVQRSSGHARLDAAACEAVRRAEFRPYLVQGRAVAATALVPIEFSLTS